VPENLRKRTRGHMRLIAAFGREIVTDSVEFVAHPTLPAPGMFSLFDPGNRLDRLFRCVEITPVPWAQTNSGNAVVFAPGSLPSDSAPCTNPVLFASQGARVLILDDTSGGTCALLGLVSTSNTTGRASLSAAIPGHPALNGFEPADLDELGRTALGARILTPPYPPGWQPILECAEPPGSPLLEYRGTDGFALLCLIDLTSAPSNSVATLLFRRLLSCIAPE
jgi:hypothetical protein